MNEIKLSISNKNEGTEAPYWLILDPRQNMRADIHELANQIIGPFFSRESAQRHLDHKRHRYGKKAKVYCHSGYASYEYKAAIKNARIDWDI